MFDSCVAYCYDEPLDRYCNRLSVCKYSADVLGPREIEGILWRTKRPEKDTVADRMDATSICRDRDGNVYPNGCTIDLPRP